MKDMKKDINKLKDIKSDINELKVEMHTWFDTIQARLEGVFGQFELTTESRINEIDFIADKVNKLEKELYF